MEAIPIPPYLHVKEVMDSEFTHLVLAHIYQRHPSYAQYYRDLGMKAFVPETRKYIILDNGAYELGGSISPLELFHIFKAINAHEVVMPDVLRDRHGTLNATARGLRTFQLELDEYNRRGPNIMIVPQGHTPGEWALCLFKQVELFMERYHYTNAFHRSNLIIGVPKWVEVFPGGRYNLIEQFVHPVVQDLCGGSVIHVQTYVHCLGWEKDLWEIGRIARDFPWIRSTDSAKPFRYAAADRTISLDRIAPSYKHGHDYFEWHLDKDQMDMARANMQTYRMAARGITRDQLTGVEYAAS